MTVQVSEGLKKDNETWSMLGEHARRSFTDKAKKITVEIYRLDKNEIIRFESNPMTGKESSEVIPFREAMATGLEMTIVKASEFARKQQPKAKI